MSTLTSTKKLSPAQAEAVALLRSGDGEQRFIHDESNTVYRKTTREESKRFSMSFRDLGTVAKGTQKALRDKGLIVRLTRPNDPFSRNQRIWVLAEEAQQAFYIRDLEEAWDAAIGESELRAPNNSEFLLYFRDRNFMALRLLPGGEWVRCFRENGRYHLEHGCLGATLEVKAWTDELDVLRELKRRAPLDQWTILPRLR